MSDQDKKISVFERIGKKPGDALTAVQPTFAGKRPYRPFELQEDGSKSATVRVHFSNGDIEIARYIYISSVIYEREPSMIGLAFQTGAIYIQGENLLSLVDLLEAERVRRIQPFDPEQHLEPDSGELLIRSVFWK